MKEYEKGNSKGNSPESVDESSYFSNEEKDLLGEIGNICMGNASTSFSKLLQRPVTITTPIVEFARISDIIKDFSKPHIALKVRFLNGIEGDNVLVMSIRDAIIIADVMMGGDGKNVDNRDSLNELEISAVSEAMNQMVASSATSMSTMFQRSIDISTPETIISYKDGEGEKLFSDHDSENIVKIKFQMSVGDLINSNIVQILSIETGKNIINTMLNDQNGFREGSTDQKYDDESLDNQNLKLVNNVNEDTNKNYNVSEAVLMPLTQSSNPKISSNIDLILDVPLEISVVLGRTKKNVSDILSLGTGSLVELEKLAEEPVDILVNGKQIATGEVVVVNENFGVRITAIISNAERVKNLNL